MDPSCFPVNLNCEFLTCGRLFFFANAGFKMKDGYVERSFSH